MSNHHFFLQYPLCAAGVVSSCRPSSWVSMVVKPSYLVLVVMLEGGGWSPAFVGQQGPRCFILIGGLHRSMVLRVYPTQLLWYYIAF